MANRPLMLEGYRVLDFSHWVAGPTCTRILGEMGADVIKVERSPEGDHVRALGVVRDGMSTLFPAQSLQAKPRARSPQAARS